MLDVNKTQLEAKEKRKLVFLDILEIASIEPYTALVMSMVFNRSPDGKLRTVSLSSTQHCWNELRLHVLLACNRGFVIESHTELS